MKKSILIFLFLFTLGGKAQGNLQFNRVINLTAGGNYTVPAGKVLKIESISINSSAVCIPKTSTVTFTCRDGAGNYAQSSFGVYAAVTYLRIGNFNYKTGGFSGGSGGIGCSGTTNSDCYNSGVGLPQIQMPLWLDSGKNINIFNDANFQILISAIEFNVVP